MTEQGQLTDRFTKTVDQLDRTGADHLQARLGAIYALERLARDSPRDQPTIIEILSAFVRTTTPRPTPAATGTTKSAMTCPSQPVSPDVHAALTVLGRRNTTHDQHSRVDLTETCLTGANLSVANFSGADLAGTNFSGADLAGTNFSGADLAEANFSGANLNCVNLNCVNLSGADLTSADLTDGDLTAADLRGARFHYADLRRATLSSVNLRNALLGGVNLAGADLSTALLAGADLWNADLNGANLCGAELLNVRHNEKTNIADVKTDARTSGKWW
ncbi:pentapeptide repeat-containing protein [Lentzea cavernae]|uniref:Pentapeptide repeat-containing protein n=1 Tax=Lentzea cavernae TaxID=2020703 RepID=A0ABQ3MXT6_9PSEU|nr:pentapeptide repeat-containing protein [Lentzea cavernae]GHH62539.1 hypothetical protein GCM10017774_90600 [Lentzea cavernae]